MYQDIKEWCQKCERCTVAKLSQPQVWAPMGHLLASRPNQIVAIDFTLMEPSHDGKEVGQPVEGGVSDWVQERQRRLQTAFDGARARLQAAAGRRKERHDHNYFLVILPLSLCHQHSMPLRQRASTQMSDKECTAPAIGLCRNLVNTFNLSWKKRDLRKAQTEANLPQHSLVLDFATRWGTKQKVIGRIPEQLPAVRQVLIDDRKHGHLNPPWQDISVLESINTVKKPVADLTDAVSGEKTCHSVLCKACWSYSKENFYNLTQRTPRSQQTQFQALLAALSSQQSAAVVASNWLEETGNERKCYWPPYDVQRIQRAVINHIPPGQGWSIHKNVRVLASCASYAKAKQYLDKSLLPDCRHKAKKKKA
ncbi:hypothetical protein MATL_G00039130 [Megalops atlanticus]|uniref:Integrase zinc-binding domain-containing protein n=1 Tax=Megalops atlanticus TaxID=7932 RepID=A0A9D3Q8B0_MEGAT|nr:hypothetical protein MATL_G00039130 [Megalops atlanticus]